MRLPWSMRSVAVRHHADLEPPSNFPRLVTASVGPSGEAIAWWSDLSRPPSSAVTITAGASTRTVEIGDFSRTESFVQPLPDGRVVLVNRTGESHGDQLSPNAAVYDADGSSVCVGSVGVGVQHVRATRQGSIWVGYDDIGVFDDDLPDGRRPVSAAGLVRFTPDLEVAWTYRDDGGGSSDIEDCYALSLAGDAAYVYPYPDLAVVRISGDKITNSWQADSTAADRVAPRALAIGDHQVTLVGGYGARDAHRVILADFDTDRWVPRRTARLLLPDGRSLDASMRVVGLDDEIHVFWRNRWYRIDIDTLAAAV